MPDKPNTVFIFYEQSSMGMLPARMVRIMIFYPKTVKRVSEDALNVIR